jgi:hypothetical protein
VANQERWDHASGEGRTTTGAEEILTVLRVRGIAVPEEALQRIQAEEDPEKLERWLEKAVIATAIGDVIDDPS